MLLFCSRGVGGSGSDNKRQSALPIANSISCHSAIFRGLFQSMNEVLFASLNVNDEVRVAIILAVYLTALLFLIGSSVTV